MAANPYYITLNFPERYIRSGIERLTIQFKVNYPGDDLNITDTSAYGVRLLNTGIVRQSYDLNEFYMSNAEFSFTLRDQQGVIYEYLFGAGWQVLEKAFLVKYEIDYGAGFITEFIGKAVQEGYIYNRNDKTIEITAAPRTDIINAEPLWDGTTALNPLGYTDNTWVSIQTVIEDIYKKIDSSMQFKFRQDWLYEGALDPTDDSNWLHDISWGEIELYTHDYFFNSSYKITTLGDLLKKLAFEFGCISGVMNNTGYFWQLFVETDVNTVVIPPEHIISRDYYYEHVIQQVKVTDRFNQTYIYGTDTGIETNIINKRTTWFIAYASPTQYYGTWRVNRGLGDRYILAVESPDVGGSYPLYMANYIARYWYNYRSSLTTKIIELELAGVGYYLHNDYQIGSQKYHPFDIQKDFKGNKTTVKMLFI